MFHKIRLTQILYCVKKSGIITRVCYDLVCGGGSIFVFAVPCGGSYWYVLYEYRFDIIEPLLCK